jgi:hypothetical protein
MSRSIYVFGSNLAGRHGAGSARRARVDHGAVYGRGEGLQGNAYAIPTKDGRNRNIPLSDPSQTLPLDVIGAGVARFLEFARKCPTWTFRVTAIGCGLAGYSPAEIAPFFRDAPDNVNLPPEFLLELYG